MIEAIVPEFLVAVEPVIGFLHRRGLQPAGDDAAILAARDQAGGGQYVEMFHHRRQRHGEGFGQFADRNGVGFAQARQQCPARRVGQGGESAVEGRGQIVNHMVKYRRCARRVKGPR